MITDTTTSSIVTETRGFLTVGISSIIMCMKTNIFLFLLFIFLDFIFPFF